MYKQCKLLGSENSFVSPSTIIHIASFFLKVRGKLKTMSMVIFSQFQSWRIQMFCFHLLTDETLCHKVGDVSLQPWRPIQLTKVMVHLITSWVNCISATVSFSKDRMSKLFITRHAKSSLKTESLLFSAQSPRTYCSTRWTHFAKSLFVTYFSLICSERVGFTCSSACSPPYSPNSVVRIELTAHSSTSYSRDLSFPGRYSITQS